MTDAHLARKQGGAGAIGPAGLHLAIIVAGISLYLLIRIALAPAGGWLRFHATDVLAGLILPSLFALWPDPPRSLAALNAGLSGKLLLVLAAAFVWEVVHPLASKASTGDWRDVVAYVVGCLLQHALVRGWAALCPPRR